MGEQKKDMELAWEIARKLSNLTDKERKEIFEYSDIGAIIKNNSPVTVYNAIMEYEKRVELEKINRGDIVRTNCLCDGIVISINYCIEDDNQTYQVIFTTGDTNTFTREQLSKTGKSVDILKTLRELIYG